MSFSGNLLCFQIVLLKTVFIQSRLRLNPTINSPHPKQATQLQITVRNKVKEKGFSLPTSRSNLKAFFHFPPGDFKHTLTSSACPILRDNPNYTEPTPSSTPSLSQALSSLHSPGGSNRIMSFEIYLQLLLLSS